MRFLYYDSYIIIKYTPTMDTYFSMLHWDRLTDRQMIRSNNNNNNVYYREIVCIYNVTSTISLQ